MHFRGLFSSKMTNDESKQSGAQLNPFTYQKEIVEDSNFVDRKDARDDIQYYLEQAALGECYNIAVTGQDSVGKSSLLNMVSKDAKDNDVLPIKIHLDRVNIVSELEFFKELYEIILSEGVEQDQIDRNLLTTFREKVSGINADAEVSLGYSSTYLSLTSGGNPDASAPRREIVSDLEELLTEKIEAVAVSLLVDDIEALSNNTDLLRKFESIVSDIDGFQLILAGENLSDELSRARLSLKQSFVEIYLEPFSEIEHTRECLLNPLAKNEEDDFEASVDEIHSFSGGSPYEIRLIGHHMYRHYIKSGDKIELTRDILDEVAESLLNTNPSIEIADQIKQLNSDYLLAVVAAVEFPNTTVEYLAECMFLYHMGDLPENSSSLRKRRENIIEQLISADILTKEDGGIYFNGTWFDRTYLKYHAASLGVINDGNFGPGDEDHLYSNIHDKIVTGRLLDDFGETKRTTRFDMEYDPKRPEGDKHHVLTNQFVTEVSVSADEWTVVDVLSQSRREEIYKPINDALWLRCNIEWLNHGFLTQFIFLGDADEQREELEEQIEGLEEDLEPLEYEFLLENEMTLFHQGNEILQENPQSALEFFEKSISIYPFFGRAWDRQGVALQMLNQHTEALVSYKMAKELDPTLINMEVNMAIIYASQGMFRQAASILENVVEDDPDYTSAWLRLSRARFSIGDIEEGDRALKNAIE